MKTLAINISTAALAIILSVSSSFALTPEGEKTDNNSTNTETDVENIQHFMTDCTFWIELTEIEFEDNTAVESWMLDSTAWKSEQAETEATLEAWMTDYTFWISEMELEATTTELWMTDCTYWLENCCDEETAPESWMSDTNYWSK